ncbi:Protein CBG23978 [Caenorhabditis briggsae]|uniref:Protein CBG23978 n=1 Tax=Caenorhabditis briggsae TaxID=6238 RepID=A8WJQ1_CAEBR|nr:Protein CBG23978 [Caenorhabditis briggsae]CAP20694.1 Protein CBG23978 [Caenorhabditis briggsae]
MLIFLLLLLHFPTFPCEDFQDLPFLASYSNWSTKGNLAPTLFRVVLDTENPPFAIRVSVTSENVTLRNPLTLNVIRGKTVHNIANFGIPEFAISELRNFKTSGLQNLTISRKTMENFDTFLTSNFSQFYFLILFHFLLFLNIPSFFSQFFLIFLNFRADILISISLVDYYVISVSGNEIYGFKVDKRVKRHRSSAGSAVPPTLPRIQSHQGQKHTYWFASDTLCDDDRSMEQLGQPVYLSVASSLPSDFQILVKPVPNFHYQEPFSTLDTPSEPRYFMYTFPNAVDKVDIRAYSETEICARLTVRRVDCPLFDGFGMLELSNDYYFQTFTKFAGFSIRKEDIGDQFHIAFTVMPDDTLCGNFTEPLWKIPDVYHRVKEAKISVTPVEEKTLVSVIPLFIYAASIIFVLLLTYFKYRLLDRHENNEPSIFEGNDLEGNVKLDKQWLFENPGEKIVSHHEYQKQRLIKDSKYFNFLFFQIFGSILPALTTLFQNYQKTSNKQNLDKCYLNYLCSLQIFNFNSLNSVASASSLAIVGILNLIIVFRKKIFCYQVPRIPTTHGIQQRDAPKVVCLLGCVAMGILGIITNNCPNKSTLHIFIYTCLWIFHSAIMWIYSKRHGVRRWHQFYIIAVSSIFGCLAFAENIFESTESSTTPLKIIFLLVTISSTGFFCYKYYFERPSGLQVSQWIPSLFSTGPTLCDANGVYRPLKSKICYMVLAMGFSVYIPVTALLNPKNTVIYSSFDWAKGQVGIYFCYYLIQKIRFERSSFTMSFKIICYGTTAIFLISETFIHDIFYHQLRTYSVQVGGHEKNNVLEISFKGAPRGVELVRAMMEGAAPLPTEPRGQRESARPIAYIKARTTAVRRVTLSVVHRDAVKFSIGDNQKCI